MATSFGEGHHQAASYEDINGSSGRDDPFSLETPQAKPQPHRYSSFDTQLFALNHPSSSPAQAKKALEAHLSETDRRIQETSKLGTTLVQQRQNLALRLRDVGSQEEDSQISPELRQKLIEIEKEYNEVGRQSARAFLGPKSESMGGGDGTPFALDGRVCSTYSNDRCMLNIDELSQNPTSPTKFSSQATDSPSKVNVPRRLRNQASKTDDIEFAAEITTSLLGQVRHLQAILVERDDALKTANLEKAKMEMEAEGFAQRLRSLDDSEQRYKDENWSLETQMQEAHAAAREAAIREQKLQQSLAAVTTEKNAAQRDLDDLRQDHSKVTEDYAAVRKSHESELATLRRSVNLGESEKGALQRRLEELDSQNRELANGLAGRFRGEETEPDANISGHDENFPIDLSEREHSPPPSPTKGAQRHSMLESETLKSSLNHAHRMIQNLKGNVHREKSEKQELKRLLQEARDELEIRRAEPNEKRLKSKSVTDIRKAGRAGLGAARNSKTDIMLDDPTQDPEWEDHVGDGPPVRDSRGRIAALGTASGHSQAGDTSDAYQTANDTEDAFETANERDTTDNDAFQTGAESMAGDSSDDLTETEDGVTRGGTVRGIKAPALPTAKQSKRRSLESTASTSDDEEDRSMYTPVQGQPQRFRLKLNRNARRSRIGSGNLDSSVPSTAKNSPASFINGGGEVGQSLYNELENLSDDGTPSKGSISPSHSMQSIHTNSMSDRRSTSSTGRAAGSQPSTPLLRPTTMLYAGDVPPVPKIPTVDSGMMTEPWEPTQSTQDPIGSGMPAAATLPQSSAAAITSRIFGPSTPQDKRESFQQASGSSYVSRSRSSSTSSQPRTVWDQPLQMFAGAIPGFGQSADTTPLSTRSTTSQARDVSADRSFSEQQPHKYPNNLAQTPKKVTPYHEPPAVTPPGTSIYSRQSLALSSIHSLETAPAQRPHPPPRSRARATSGISNSGGANDGHAKSSSSGGLLGSVFGWNKPKTALNPDVVEDETNQDLPSTREKMANQTKTPLDEVPANVMPRHMVDEEVVQTGKKPTPIDMSDSAAQTLLSSEQIDNMLNRKDPGPAMNIIQPTSTGAMKPLSAIGASSSPMQSYPPQESSEMVQGKAPEQLNRDLIGKSIRRPASASSMRSRATTAQSQYPPLPPDHQEAIAAAASRAPSVEPPGSMGPPLAPASAYIPRGARNRTSSRPQTPSQQGLPTPSSKGGTTPRAGRYSTTRSQVSRRSSFSSFASELDERFNIRTDGMPMAQGFHPNTDPRMIQAITQTMIGEMMWKYTRKAGRGEMSSTRHRRFFWVHPYTRTLYWSDRDPASANRAELKSKSVAIEAVRVVTDDNPMPPGLHRKSLIIITPGRSVKFTAQTSQRHETWFNALSYLLLRTGPDGTNAADYTDADVDEFNPQPGYNRRTSRSRVSLASFKSNRTQNRQDQSRLSSMASPAAPTERQGRQSQYDAPPQAKGSVRSRISRSLSRSRASRQERPNFSTATITNNNTDKHGSLASRMSSFGDSVRHSMRSRSSMRNEHEEVEPGVLEGGRSIISASGADSAEDLRRVIEERESGGRLENVRACCDGKSNHYLIVNVSMLRIWSLTFRIEQGGMT